MRKIFFCFFVFSISGYVYAQDFNLRHYSDHRNGFRGVASAIFINNFGEIDLSELDERMLKFWDEIGIPGRSVDRITRNNYWLARQALNEWDIKDGDLFLIICAESRVSEEALLMIALIENRGENFRWWGRIVSMRDIW